MKIAHLIITASLLSFVNATLYDEHKRHYFSTSRASTLTVSSDVYKQGNEALKWTWQPGDSLTLDLSQEPVESNQIHVGGIKIWFYLRKIVPEKMTLSFHALVNSTTPALPECEFGISLKFTGWRAVWVSFAECRLRKLMSALYLMRIRAPIWRAGVIYFDLLRIVRTKMGKQSRDNIVPPIRDAMRSTNFWQQTYRWSLVKPKRDIFNEIELNEQQLRHLKDIRLIRTRLRDWYRVKLKSTHDLTGHYKTRWLKLKSQIKRARKYLRILNITKTKDGFIKGPPLFSRNSEYGKDSISAPDKKFGFVMRTVLFPLAFEYYFASRKEEIHRTTEIVLPKLKTPRKQRTAVQKLVGSDKEFINIFYDKYKIDTRPLTRQKLRKILKEINHKRFLRIVGVLEYILDQGWAVGSALGSLDHEMNRSSKGFVTALFLLRKSLYRSGFLPQFIDIMKWYLEFGEVYQNPFEYPGTTADRLRTLFLYRLMCVLIMPETSLEQALDKLHDMRALKAWYENALSINPALGGTIKPDYTGFHHQSFYPSDYVLPGLLTASHVVYMLRGTEYELSETSRSNLRNAINFMRLLSSEYVIPNSLTNTNPTVAKPALICLIPAFAYMSLWNESTRDNFLPSETLTQDQHTLHIDSLRAFLRMFNESNVHVQKYLAKGKFCSWKTSYMFTLGSLSILYELKQRAIELGIEPEPFPQGNWAKNFAALAIHRRQNWVVTVKGFNNFIWGHESSHRGNIYGRYQSYGQLLIAGSDQGLKTHDVDRGWDWTRLPGTTTLRVPADHLRDPESRYYNPKSLCGAMNFQGTSRLRNGVFTMDFARPAYRDRKAKFWFKKSVFFYDELVVCIGSDIKARRFTFRPIEVETTLFQNIGNFEDKIHSIRANGLEVPVAKEHRGKFTWERNSAGMLMDVNLNGYYIPRAGKQGLHVMLLNQTSKSTGATTSGYYATAVLRHGGNPNRINYEYAILVNSSYDKLYRFSCRQEKLRGLPKYEILKQDSHAHVLKFNNAPRFGITTYGYSIFTPNTILPGSLWMVGDQCVLMVEDGGKKSTRLIIGVSYPQLNFNSTRKMRTMVDIKEEEQFYMKSHEKRIWVLLRSKVKEDGYRVFVDGKEVNKQDVEQYVSVYSLHEEASASSMVYFKNLFNGFTTEVHLRRVISPSVEV